MSMKVLLVDGWLVVLVSLIRSDLLTKLRNRAHIRSHVSKTCG